MEKRNFALLLALNASDAAIGKAFMQRIKADVDPAAAPLWIDSRGIGVFVSTDLPAWKVWKAAYPDSLTREQQMALKDLLILSLAPGCLGDREGRAMAWLNSRGLAGA